MRYRLRKRKKETRHALPRPYPLSRVDAASGALSLGASRRLTLASSQGVETMKPIYTLRNDEWRITVKIGREPMNASKPIAAHYYCDDASTENGLRFSERKLYRNFDEAL